MYWVLWCHLIFISLRINITFVIPKNWCEAYYPFYLGLQGKSSNDAPRSGCSGRNFRLLMTKNPVQLPVGTPFLVWTDPAALVDSWRYRAPPIVLTALWDARGTQRVIDSGFVLIERRATRYSPSASPVCVLL